MRTSHDIGLKLRRQIQRALFATPCAAHSFSACLIIALATMAAVPRTALAQSERVWSNSAGGAWSVAANWSPNNVPNTAAEFATLGFMLGDVNLDVSATVDKVMMTSVRASLVLDGTTLTATSATGLSNSFGQDASGADGSTILGLVTNFGTITANAGDLLIDAPSITNTGTIRASGGQTLTIDCPLVTNTNGVLQHNGGFILLRPGVEVVGGSVEGGASAGDVRVTGPVTFENVALGDLATVQILSGSLALQGSALVNDGLIKVGSVANVESLLVINSLTATGAGEIDIVSVPTALRRFVVAPSAVFTNGASHTVSGEGFISGSFRNLGTIRADQDTLQFLSRPINYTPADSLFVDGTWRIENGATLQIDGMPVAKNNATIVIEGTGSRFRSGNTEALTTLWWNLPGGDISFSGAPTGFGQVGPSLINEGRIYVGSGSSVTLGRDLDQAAGTLTVDGVFGSNFTTINVNGGELSGVGQINAAVVNNASVAPGGQARELLIFSSYEQTPNGTLRIELGNHAQGRWDTLRVASNATLDGTLAVEILPGFVPVPGTRYVVLACDSLAGAFDRVLVDGVEDNGSLFSVDYSGTSATLVVTGVNFTGVEAPGATSPHPSVSTLAGRLTSDGVPVFELALPSAANVRLEVFDVAGRRLGVLAEGSFAAGRHSIRIDEGAFDARRLASGVYFGRAEVADGAAVKHATARVLVVH